MLLTEADELALGKDTDAQISQIYGIYENQELSDYVNSMGSSMGKLSHRSNLAYNFKVLDTPVINAFAVPGGYVYFTRGILAYLNNEAELAGVMGHEIGHITARHSAKQYSQATLAQIGLGAAMNLSEEFQKYAGIAQFGVSMLFLKFSRDNERQADALGVEYSTKAGFDATNMANFFKTLERLHPSSAQSGLPEWFSTHPNPPDRIAAITRDAGTWKTKVAQTNFVVNTDKYLQTIDGIVFGEDPRQGYVDGNIFYHPTLRFQFPVPGQWQIINTPSQVQMFTQAQDAVMLFSLASESTPSDAANNFILNTKADVKESNNVQVNGLTARRVVTEITNEQSVIRVMSYFITKDNRVFVFHGFTTVDKYATYSSTFQNTMEKFNNLTDQNRINVQPKRLRVKQARTQRTLRQVLLNYGVTQDKLEEMAILNGKGLNDTIPANTLVKIVE